MSRNIKKILCYAAVYIVFAVQIYFLAESIYKIGLIKTFFTLFPLAWIYGTHIVSIGMLAALIFQFEVMCLPLYCRRVGES